MSQPAAPLLSVVVPVYNGAKYIPNAFASLKRAVATLPAADRALVEVILCDNHSTDDTIALAEASRPDCAYRVIAPPTFYDNRCKNWDFGLRAAAGTWMMMLHADDMLSDGGIVSLFSAIRRPTPQSAVLIEGRHRDFTENDVPPTDLKPRWSVPSLVSGDGLRRGPLSFFCPFVPFITMRRAVYEKIGGLNTNYELIQDWDLWVRFLAEGDLLLVPDEVGCWRVHGTTEKYNRIFMREHLDLAYRMPELVPALSADAARYSVTFQRAKVRHSFPNEPIEDFMTGVKAASVTLTEAEIAASRDNPEAVLVAGNKKVSQGLMTLRAAGALRLLTAR